LAPNYNTLFAKRFLNYSAVWRHLVLDMASRLLVSWRDGYEDTIKKVEKSLRPK
jgi:hypothetical protein